MNLLLFFKRLEGISSVYAYSTINRKLIFAVILLITLSTSCTKFVAIDPPSDRLESSGVYASDETAIAALTTIYSRIVSEGGQFPYSIALYTGFSSDELTNYSSNKNIRSFYLNSHSTIDNGNTVIVWNTLYKLIYQANAVYEGCERSQQLSITVKKQLMAEALFLRAFLHFYLVNLFGDVPIAVTTDYTVNSKIARSPIDQVYNQITTDLKWAIDNLNPDYVGANGTDLSVERVRPNQFAAMALLARVSLYAGKYADAITYASKVIDNKSQYDLVSLDEVFLTTSREAIWQLMTPLPSAQNINTPEGLGFILIKKPSTTAVTSNISTISNHLMNVFEEDDDRKSSWLSKFTDVSVTPNMDYYYPFKYKVRTSTTLTEYTTPIRLAEMYLIRGEAKAQNDDVEGGKEDLDVIRTRAGLDNSLALDKQTLLKAIYHEREAELFCEWGHRWFDIKRTRTVNNVMTIAAEDKGSVWADYQQLWPIPQAEIDNDQNLKQNAGYQ